MPMLGSVLSATKPDFVDEHTRAAIHFAETSHAVQETNSTARISVTCSLERTDSVAKPADDAGNNTCVLHRYQGGVLHLMPYAEIPRLIGEMFICG